MREWLQWESSIKVWEKTNRKQTRLLCSSNVGFLLSKILADFDKTVNHWISKIWLVMSNSRRWWELWQVPENCSTTGLSWAWWAQDSLSSNLRVPPQTTRSSFLASSVVHSSLNAFLPYPNEPSSFELNSFCSSYQLVWYVT